jgi:RNA polymerase sigma-70 factor, ECF subfamily
MRGRAFERLYAAHAQALLAFLAYRTGDRSLAEDLLAETFERALRARGRFDRRRGSEKTWLYAIALNALRDHHRRLAAESRALDRYGDELSLAEPREGTEGVEARDAIQRVLALLSSEEREALALRYGGDLTLPEIARTTGERLPTVEGRVYRGLRKLRDALGDNP